MKNRHIYAIILVSLSLIIAILFFSIIFLQKGLDNKVFNQQRKEIIYEKIDSIKSKIGSDSVAIVNYDIKQLDSVLSRELQEIGKPNYNIR